MISLRFLALNVATLVGLATAWFVAHDLRLVGAIVLLHAFLFVRGVAHPASSLFLPVRSRGSERTKVALTFDDGPGDATRAVLGVLSELGVKATFFVVGENVKGREDVLRAAYNQGHVIGSHSFAHSWLTNFYRSRRMKDEVARGIDAVAAVIGKRPRLYRPPIGLKSPSLAWAARELGLVVVGWRRRGRDGGAGGGDPAAIVGRLLAARGGEVLLLHDGVEPGRKGDRQATLKALRELIPLLRARGLELVTVDQLLGEKAYS
jgi:peptidoglycan/xylan/chitin deacetylase (PgdA/CDA1 family)